MDIWPQKRPDEETGEAVLLTNWLLENASAITIWCAALSTFAIYSVLYAENKFYRFFEHIFIGLASGYGVYIAWSHVLGPKWWSPMVQQGQWYWAFAGVAGSMFYFMYSKKHVWISRVIFGAFMGLAAGGIFREFYEIYFPQIGSSMKPLVTAEVLATGHLPTILGHILSVVIFYGILFAAMSYFFFSFEHKNVALKKTASAGRWFLMIGFGAIFGATVMGRMTLFIGRFNFLINQWIPEVQRDWSSPWFRIITVIVGVVAALLITRYIIRRGRTRKTEQESDIDEKTPTGV